jgi:hypothetical protein
MPPAAPKDAAKYRPSFYKFRKLKKGLTLEEFNKPMLDQLMEKLLIGPIHAKDYHFDTWLLHEVKDQPYPCSNCGVLGC